VFSGEISDNCLSVCHTSAIDTPMELKQDVSLARRKPSPLAFVV